MSLPRDGRDSSALARRGDSRAAAATAWRATPSPRRHRRDAIAATPSPRRRRRGAVAATEACCEVRSAQAKSAPKTRALALDDDDKCDACRQIAAFPCGRANKAHTCGKQGKSPAQGDVGRCELKGKDKWAFPPCTIFMPKTAVPKVLGRPGSRGSNLLWPAQKHYKKHNVYKTTDAKGDTVYYAHEGSL